MSTKPGQNQGPVAALKEAYAYFGLEFTDTVGHTMQAFLDSGSETERHGKHSYNLADSGLDLARERQHFATYQNTYNIPSESF